MNEYAKEIFCYDKFNADYYNIFSDAYQKYHHQLYLSLFENSNFWTNYASSSVHQNYYNNIIWILKIVQKMVTPTNSVKELC